MIIRSTFGYIYLIMTEIKHLFMYLRDIRIFLSVSSLIISFPVLSIGLLVFYYKSETDI